MFAYVCFDLIMACLMLLFGLLFYRSDGKAANLLAGYNHKTEEERNAYDEKEMCKAYGKRMMFMAVPFLIGAAADIFLPGAGSSVAWLLWIILLIRLLLERHRREKLEK